VGWQCDFPSPILGEGQGWGAALRATPATGFDTARAPVAHPGQSAALPPLPKVPPCPKPT
jgi:hypothetical protein